ncbi:MAG: sugar ABC transporter permease [Clostridiales bacterium]|nr:sugar ABC transporter permease [Clostridiales bacterium]
MHVKKHAFVKNFKRCWQLHLFMLLGVAYILIFAYYPMAGVQIAFKDYTPAGGIWGSPWVGLKHFNKYFNSMYFERTVFNTLRISIYSIVVGFPLPIIFALMLNLMRNQKLKKFIQTVTYIPHFISVVVLVGMMMQLFSPVVGLYGSLYRIFTDGVYPPDIYSKSHAFIHIYVWSGVWQELGWGSIIYLAALSGVSPELHEAAMIDGASRWKRVWHVDLPAILPTVAIMLIMRSGSVMSVGFEKTYLMQNGMNLSVSEVITTYVYKQGLGKGVRGFSFGSAVGLFNSVVNFAMLVLVNTVTKKLSDGNSGLF